MRYLIQQAQPLRRPNGFTSLPSALSPELLAESLKLVAPLKHSEVQLLFPAPSWARRRCLLSCLGSCSEEGQCICSPGYTGAACEITISPLAELLRWLLVPTVLMLLGGCYSAVQRVRTVLREAHEREQELADTVQAAIDTPDHLAFSFALLSAREFEKLSGFR